MIFGIRLQLLSETTSLAMACACMQCVRSVISRPSSRDFWSQHSNCWSVSIDYRVSTHSQSRSRQSSIIRLWNV